ncbi:hypothetical protein ACLX1H_006433 [Fusarium chlamydosporum]
MATAETVDLGPAHPPKEDAIIAFEQVSPELKKTLVHTRRDYNSQYLERAYASGLSNTTSAYGIHLFGKLRIPAMPDPSGPAYIHFRIFIGGGDEPPKLHCIHTEEREDSSGGKTYRAVFTKNDELE